MSWQIWNGGNKHAQRFDFARHLTMSPAMIEWLVLVAFGVATMGAAATGAAFPPGDWYRTLDKPSWTPPDWAFPLVWLALYIGMLIAVWRVALSGDPLAALGVALWSAQIVLNALWSPVFFGLNKIAAGLGVLIGLWVAVALCGVVFALVDVIAGLLFIPYLIWVTTAGALNLSVLRRNPGA
jgi:tryptophan-rich sensory protein